MLTHIVISEVNETTLETELIQHDFSQFISNEPAAQSGLFSLFCEQTTITAEKSWATAENGCSRRKLMSS